MGKVFQGYWRTFIFYNKPRPLAGNIDYAVRLCVGNRICQNIRYGLFNHSLRKMYGKPFLYDTRKKGKSLTLFLLFVLITVFVTISFSVLSATQAAAAHLRETVGASFTLRGNPLDFNTDGADYEMQFAPISQREIDLILGSTEIKACNAQQSDTATASSFFLPSGMPSGTEIHPPRIGSGFTLRQSPKGVMVCEDGVSVKFHAWIALIDADNLHRCRRVFERQFAADTATASSFFLPSGMPSGTISANTSSVWNRNFTSGILTLAEGRHITQEDRHAALVSRELADENELQIGSELSFKDPAATVEIIGIYESDPS